jgi:GntR family transcriptional repressor for pyruvate dehydrogenase complex
MTAMTPPERPAADLPVAPARRAARRGRSIELPGIEPVSPTRISDEVSEQIRRLIISEDIEEGARLPSERRLAERFGASRPTVSQALRRLSLMGMVEIRRGSGAYVMRKPQSMVTASVNLMLDLNSESVNELMQLRLWLETLGAEQAAQAAGERSLTERREIEQALQRLLNAAPNPSAWIAADTVFHALVVKSGGNSYLAAIYESVHTAILGYEYEHWVRNDSEPSWIGDADVQRELHEPIARGVLDGDVELTRDAVFRHHGVMLEHLLAGHS